MNNEKKPHAERTAYKGTDAQEEGVICKHTYSQSNTMVACIVCNWADT